MIYFLINLYDVSIPLLGLRMGIKNCFIFNFFAVLEIRVLDFFELLMYLDFLYLQ
jgi:hypothetical protein